MLNEAINQYFLLPSSNVSHVSFPNKLNRRRVLPPLSLKNRTFLKQSLMLYTTILEAL